tara:strand:+ start:343 stop:918 length:576 start_codon:yes stop_codon:yes gene_type:complete
MKTLNNKLAQVQTKLKAKKSSFNSFGKYYFRKSEDILEAIKPFLLELDVSVTISEKIVMTDPVPILESSAIFSDGENQIVATAMVGVDLNQKGMQTAQQFGAASTYGKKYALGNLLLIDDTEDADASNSHGKGSAVIDKLKASMPSKPKEPLTKGSDKFKAAKKYIAEGGDINAIKGKYEISAAVEKELTK